jgi:hypothetical protein
MSVLDEKIKYEIGDTDEIISKELFGEQENPEDPCSINKLTIENNVSNILMQEMGSDDDDYNPFE